MTSPIPPAEPGVRVIGGDLDAEVARLAEARTASNMVLVDEVHDVATVDGRPVRARIVVTASAKVQLPPGLGSRLADVISEACEVMPGD